MQYERKKVRIPLLLVGVLHLKIGWGFNPRPIKELVKPSLPKISFRMNPSGRSQGKSLSFDSVCWGRGSRVC